MISRTSNLVLLNGNNTVVWSTVSNNAARDLILQLLDSGDFVLSNNQGDNPDIYLWQSFDYPSDTLLHGMKHGWDLRTSLNRRLSSWNSPDDPSLGKLSKSIELDAFPQNVMWKGTRKYVGGGPWNGLRFSGSPELRNNPVFDFKFVTNNDEVYYMYELLNKSMITRLVLNDTTSSRQRYVWVEVDRSWKLYALIPRVYCDNYGLCDPNGVCVINGSPVCQCLKGFNPKLAHNWNSMDWSRGCTRSDPLDGSSRKHSFMKLSSIKLPDTTNSLVNKSMNLKECNEACLKNCSCMAYTNSDINGQGSGYALWFGDLVDIKQLTDGGQDLYIRMRASNRGKISMVIIATIIVLIASTVVLVIAIFYLCRGKSKVKGNIEDGSKSVAQKEDLDLPLLKLATVARDTDNFSVNMKLGERGFWTCIQGITSGWAKYSREEAIREFDTGTK